MSKKILWRLSAILMVAMLSVGFASCGDDDDPEPPNTDGLKGYWLEDYPDGHKNNPRYMFYLDGKGGGIYYGWTQNDVTWLSEGNEEDIQDWYPVKIGTFNDIVRGGTRTFYTENKGEACQYTQKASVITIIRGKGYPLIMVNVVDGAISGYHRVTKVK